MAAIRLFAVMMPLGVDSLPFEPNSQEQIRFADGNLGTGNFVFWQYQQIVLVLQQAHSDLGSLCETDQAEHRKDVGHRWYCQQHTGAADREDRSEQVRETRGEFNRWAQQLFDGMFAHNGERIPAVKKTPTLYLS